MASSEQISQFHKLCKQATDDDTEVLQLVKKRFSKADKSFLASHEFKVALCTAYQNIKKDTQNKFVHLKKFLSLLKANDGKKRKKSEHESDSSEPTAKRQKKAGSNEYSDGSESGPGGSKKHKTEEKAKEKQVTQMESDSDTDPLTTATNETTEIPKSEKKLKSEENAKEKQIESDSDTEPLSTTKNETKEFPKSEKKANSESPAAKELKSESPAKGYAADQQLTILPLTPVKHTSPENVSVPTSYKSPTARYKYCHVAELRLTDDDDDKSSKTSVKSNSDENIITHIPRKKVARIALKPLTPSKLPNGKSAVIIPGTPKHSVRGDRSPAAATVTSPAPEYVFVSLDTEQQLVVCEEGDKAARDGDCEVLSDVASIPDIDDNDAVDPPEEEEGAVEEKRKQEEDEEEDGPVPVKGSRKQLKKLEVLLDKISGEIRKLENRELSLDELADDNSAYAMEDRYKKKFCKVWDKYCEVAGRPPTTGRPTERKFRFEGTRYPEVNRKIERFVNVKHVFPDYHDIRDIIGKVNKKYHLRLRPTAVDNLAREAFTVVGNELQKRRMLDFSADFESRLDEPIRPYSDPALFDRGLRERLEKNKKIYKSRMSEVLEKFARKQDDGDDAEDTDEDEEEEEEEQEAASEEEEEEAESDIEKMFSLPITSLVKIKVAAESEPVPSTSWGGENAVSPEAGVKTPTETPVPTEQDNFMSAFGLQVRPQQKKSPLRVEKEVDLGDKQSVPQIYADVDIDKKDKQSIPQVDTAVDISKKDKQSIPQVHTDVDIDKKDKQSIPQVHTDVDISKKDKQSIPQVHTDVDINKNDKLSIPQVHTDVDIDKKEKQTIPQIYTDVDIDTNDKQSIPQVHTDVDIDNKDQESVPQACKEVDLEEKDTKSPLQIYQDVDLDEEDKKSAPQVYKELDIDEELEIHQISDDDEDSQRQVYKQLDIDDELDMDDESDEENQRQVYKQLDIDEELDMDDESDDDEENQRQVYKELDIDEKSEGDINQCEVADGSQDLFGGSDDNDVHYEEMEDSPRIVPYEENSGGPFLYVEPDEEVPKSSNDTESRNSSLSDVFPGALTYIDVADEDSRDVNIAGSIRQEDVEDVISSVDVQLLDDPESEFSLSRRESIESLGSVHENRTENSLTIYDMRQRAKGNEKSNSDEQIYVEKGTLSQPISIEDSQQCDNNTDKQKDISKIPDHSVNVGDRGKENGERVSDQRKSRLKLPRHKTTSAHIDSQTVEPNADNSMKAKTIEKAFALGTVTFVDSSSEEEEVPIITKAPEQRPDGSGRVNIRSSTDITPPKILSSNKTSVANANDEVMLTPASVNYKSVETPMVKGPDKVSPADKNVVEAENRNRKDKTETPKKSQTPERNIKVPEKGSPNEPIDVDENEQEDQPHNTPGKGSESQPINVDSACSMDIDDVGLSATGTKNLKGDIKTSTPPQSHHHSSPNNAVRSSPEAAAQRSALTGEQRNALGEADRSDKNKYSQQSKETQQRAKGSSNITKLNNSSDVIEIDDDSLVGSPEKIPAKLPTAAAAAKVQRPVPQPPMVQRATSQPPIPVPKAQTVDLTLPQGKKKFDPKATINIMNKVLAQSNANAPAVFTQTIADMISKVSAEVFSENANNGQKPKNAVPGNQRGQSAGNRRQNVGPPMVNRAPGGANRAPGGANRAPGGANRTPLGANRAPLGANRAPLGANRAPLGANRAPLGANRAPLGANRALVGANRTPVPNHSPVPNRAPVPNRIPVSPSQSDSRRRLNTNRVLPKSFQTNQAALVQSAGLQKNYYAPANSQSQPNAGNPSTTGTLPNPKSIAGPQLNAANTGSTVNAQPLLLVQNTANVAQARVNARHNPRPNQPVFNRAGGNQRQVVGNQRPEIGRVKPVSPRSAGTGRPVQGNLKSYTFNRKGVVVSPRSNRPVSASSMRVGQSNGAANNNKHLTPKRLLYPELSRQVVSGQRRGRPSEVDFQQSIRHKAQTSTPRPSRSPNQPQQIAIGQEGGLKIMSYSSLATGMTVPVQSAQQKRPASRPPATGNVSRGQEDTKKPKIETVVLSDSD